MNHKIVILYASVGGGHFKAAEAIQNYITTYYPDCTVEMLDALKYTNKAIDKIIIKSYVNMARYSPELWGDIYHLSERQYSVANFSNAVQKLLSLKLIKYFKEQKPDIIVSTHPFITEMCAVLKKKEKIDAKLNVVITDYVSHRFWELKPEYINHYFVANQETKYNMIANGIAEEKIHVTGIPISPNFFQNYNKEDIYREFDLEPHKKTVLIFGGGEYGLSNVKKFYQGLLAIKQDIQIVTIAGKRVKTKKMFTSLANHSSKKIIILGYTTKIPELMQIADLVISKPGGLTTTEIINSHIPFVIINPIPGQEEENAHFLLNNGAAVQIYNSEKTTPFIENLLTDTVRLENIKAMQAHIAHPLSTKEIVETILN